MGYSLDTWREQPNFWREIVPEEDWERAVRQANLAYAKGVPGAIAFRCVAKDGRILHMESYNSVITDQHGQRIGTCGVVLDVSERKQREQEILRLTRLIENERYRLDAIIRNVPGIIYDVSYNQANSEQTLNYISDYVERMLGYRAEDLYQAPDLWGQITEPEGWKKALEEAQAALQEGRPGNAQFQCKTADGEWVYAESFFSFAQMGEELRQFGLLMDVTPRRQAEEALHDYMEELRRSNAELEQFAYVASHDLQEPLRMVTSYLQLIEQRYQPLLDDDGREFIHFAVDGATRMKTLINDLLAYSRVQRSTAAFAPLEMPAVLDQVLQHLQARIEDTGAVVTCDPLPQLVGIESQMVQLLQNLLSNA
ncbi:MAG: PAS domain-containing protein, partial [Anaerolineae bacterium]|nr:PAS domain-containing protein [Anaerolineae bacterium]